MEQMCEQISHTTLTEDMMYIYKQLQYIAHSQQFK
jgi:hypothetical protein